MKKALWGIVLGGSLLALPIVTARAAEVAYAKGEAVRIDLYGDGREVHTGVVVEIYDYSWGRTYSVKWGEDGASMGSVPASRLSQIGGAPKPAPKAETQVPEPGPGLPPAVNPPAPVPGGKVPAAPDANPAVTAADLDYFVGKWRLTKWGGGTTVERGGDVYKEYLLNVSSGAPLTINADYSWAWKDAEGRPISGKWRKLAATEDILFGGRNGLVLLGALGGKDWEIDFQGVKAGKDLIKIKSGRGSFDGERIGVSKGVPAWNRVQFAINDTVVVTLPGGAGEAPGVIDQIHKDNSGVITYHVSYTESSGSKQTGYFQPIKIRRR